MSDVPQEIHKQIVQKYSSCYSYQDEGEIEASFISQDWSSSPMKLRFASSFVSPMIFRFDYLPEDGSGGIQFSLVGDGESFRYVVFQDGKLQSSSAIPNMASAIRPFNGLSYGHIVIMAELLMPAVRSAAEYSIDNMTDLQLEAVAGAESSHLAFLHGRKGEVQCQFLIDRESFEIIECMLKMPEPEDLRTTIDRSQLLAREAGFSDSEDFALPSDSVNVRTAFKVNKRSFNDSLTIDSVVTV